MGSQTGTQTVLIRVVALAMAALFVLTGFAAAQLGGLLPPPGINPKLLVSGGAIDPVLSAVLQSASSDQLIRAVVTFEHYPTATDLLAIQLTGVKILPFRALPMVAVRGTSLQIQSLFTLPGLVSLYWDRQLSYFSNESVPLVGAKRVWNELKYTGKGVTVAVIDSGIDSAHPDLPFGAKVVQNVKLAPDLFGTGPLVMEGLLNTDTTSGHGTHVASTAGGTGGAIDSKLVGIGAGEGLFIFTALEGFDWILQNRTKYGIRVVSNSWGTSGAFSLNDPINVASKMAHDQGLVVIFAAGNAGPGQNTLNPYCVASWVICVAAGLKDGPTPADFSSRGIPGDSTYHPTITAPGLNLGAARGTVALMLEANPALTPDQVKSVLEQTAIPMPSFQQHEVGAGYLNTYGAVRMVR